MRVGVARALADNGLLGEKFTKILDTLPWTPMNRQSKCEATSFIIGGEIRNRTNTETNSNRYIHTCLSACAYRHVWIMIHFDQANDWLTEANIYSSAVAVSIRQ